MTKHSNAQDFGALGYSQTGSVTLRPHKRTLTALLAAASVSVLSVGMTSEASAQAVPPECTPTVALTGGTIVCVAPVPTEIGQILTRVDDLTVVVGDATTPTTVRNNTPPPTLAGGNPIGVGIDIRGGGDLSLRILNAASSVYGAQHGVFARVDSGGGTTSVYSEGSIVGAYSGVVGGHSGTGSIVLNVDRATGIQRSGISASLGGYGKDISISATGLVKGGIHGINVSHSGTGALVVDSVDVTGEDAYGVTLSLNGFSATQSATINSSGTISGKRKGIVVRTTSYASTSINVNNVSAATQSAIEVRNYSRSKDISITSTGTIQGASRGIEIRNSGTGNIFIDVNDITGGLDGIQIDNRDPVNGSITVKSSGLIKSTGVITAAQAIDIRHLGSGPIEVDVNNVSGRIGIDVSSFSGAPTTITSSGLVEGTLTVGITAVQRNGSLSLNVNDVIGKTAGISTRTADAETVVTLGSTANVTGQTNAGIIARSTGVTADITVRGMSGNIVGATDGLDIDTVGADILVDNLDSVTGNAGDGINATSNGGNITVTEVGTVLGKGLHGIKAVSDGGDISIQGVGLVGGIEGVYAAGIHAKAGVGAINIGGIDAIGDVTTRGVGIYAYGYGSEEITIDSSNGKIMSESVGILVRNILGGTLTVTSADVTSTMGDGINAKNISISGTGTTIDSSAGSVVGGGRHGIYAINGAFGALNITSANVTAMQDGIRASNGPGNTNGTKIDSTAGSIMAGRNGIYVSNFGPGTLNITTADITAANGRGIFAGNNVGGSGAGDLTIDTTAGTVTVSNGSGIQAANNGTGEVRITSADVAGAGQNSNGIRGRTAGSGLLTINSSAGTVAGGNNGILANAQGTGNIQVTTNAVTGTNGAGIYAVIGVPIAGAPQGIVSTITSTADIDITANGIVQGGQDGILAVNTGTGNLSIVAQDDVLADTMSTGPFGTGSFGIRATANGDVTVDVQGDTTGGLAGILATSNGGLNITATNATGTNAGSAGIIGYNSLGTGQIGTDSNITATGTVSGGAVGVFVIHNGAGALTIDVGSAISTNAPGVGTGNIGINAANGQGSDFSITSTGSAAGDLGGIRAINGGFGALTIDSNDVASLNGNGIYAANQVILGDPRLISGPGGTDLTIISTGMIAAGDNGIYAHNTGSGATSISVNQIISGDIGIRVENGISNYFFGPGQPYTTGGTSLDVTATGDIVAGSDGILAINYGTGPLSIEVANIGAGARGVLAVDRGTGLTINANGNIVAADEGIHAVNNGTGATVITLGSTATITSQNSTGILASSSNAASSITVQGMSGDIVGATDGLDIDTMGADIFIDNLDSVTGNAGDGIDAVSGGGNITITSVDTILGTGGNGILAAAGTGDISIQGSGLVGGITGTGSGDITIDGTTFSGANGGGILAVTDGEINIGGISANGDINSVNADGVHAQGGNSGGITVDSSANNVTGGRNGIFVQNLGAGAVTVSATDVTGTNGTAIQVTNGVRFGMPTPPMRAGTDIVITTTGQVVGGTTGIQAFNRGTGVVNISANSVTGNGFYGAGIYAANYGAGVSINASGAVTGADTGINASNRGTGSVDINVVDVTGNRRSGLVVSNRSSGTSVFDGDSISVTSTGSIVGGSRGLGVFAYGSGLTSIDVVNVSSSNNFGAIALEARSLRGGIDISVSGDVTGASGIDLENSGLGSASIAVNNVTASQGRGIYAENFGNGVGALGDLTISVAGDVSAANTGIFARNRSLGFIDVDTVNVQSDFGDGIYALGLGTSIDISSTGDVNSRGSGINVINIGSGATNISVNSASSTGFFSLGAGIRARNGNTGSSFGTDLIINATGTVSGYNGIAASNYGSGETIINANNVTGMGSGGFGITVQNRDNIGNSFGTDMSVTATGDVTGALGGIRATSVGTGSLDIIANNVTGTRDSAVGLFAYQGPNGDGITINTTGTITGGLNATAVGAYNSGSGALTANVNNLSGYYGIRAFNLNGTDLSIISTGSINSTRQGIYTTNYGSGALTISANDVESTGANYSAIKARNEGTDLSITVTGNVVGGLGGIDAHNDGTGPTTITLGSSATVDGQSGIGIRAISTNALSNVTVQGSSGDIIGATDGLDIDTMGADIFVDNLDSVTGQAGDGIDAMSNGGNITITAVDTILGTGGRGILAVSDGGDISIQGSGLVGGITGTTSDGIFASTGFFPLIGISGVTGNIDIGGTTAIGDVTGADNGIVALAGGTTSITIGSNGHILGSTNGIFARNYGGGATVINVADVTATNRNGIDVGDVDGPSGISITATGTITAYDRGISAYQRSQGSLVINTNEVVGTGGYSTGIYARAVVGAAPIDIAITAAGDIEAAFKGIHVQQDTNGKVNIVTEGVRAVGANPFGDAAIDVSSISGQSVEITTNGVVSSAQGTGIQVLNDDVTITTNDDVYGQKFGITVSAALFGTGAITIDSGNVTADAYAAIGVGSRQSTTDVAITSDGLVSGGSYGIEVGHRGTGMLTINANDVVSTTGTAIQAQVLASYHYGAAIPGTGISITTTGDVQGQDNGIVAQNQGAGPTTIDAKSVSGTAGFGIYASNANAYFYSDAEGISVTATGAVSGGSGGVFVRNYGLGETLIDVDSVTGLGGDGIAVSTFGRADTDISASGLVSGSGTGINANSFGFTDDLATIEVTSVTGDSGNGITVSGFNSASITAIGPVSGGDTGIFANSRSGGLIIDVADVSGFGTGSNSAGIRASTSLAGSSLSISSTGTIFGNSDGINVFAPGSVGVTLDVVNVTAVGDDAIVVDNSTGTGDISVTVTGSVVSQGDEGIVILNLDQGNIALNAVDIDSVNSAIRIENRALLGTSRVGGGNVAIVTSGDVHGGNDAITVDHDGTGALDISVNNVTGGLAGIRTNSSIGATTITLGSTAIVEGQAGAGIAASSTGAMANITVQGSSGDIIGATDGLDIDTMGADILVDNLDSVTGNAGDGIDAESMGGAITITAVDTILGAGGNGILAVSGGGDISVQGSGLVGGITGTVAEGINSDARGGTGGAINIGDIAAIGDVTAAASGVVALTDGTGNITIDSSAGTITGGTNGVVAQVYGAGAVSVMTSAVTGTANNGILARSTGGGVTVDSSAGSVMGGTSGIYARDFGTNAVSVTTADVTGTTAVGIYAGNSAAGTDLTVDSSAGSVNGATHGIRARNRGTGTVNVTTADVTGTDVSGISAGSIGGDVTVDSVAGTVTGFVGINAQSSGAGAIRITSSDVAGSDDSSGLGGFGIYAQSTGGGITMDSRAGMVTGHAGVWAEDTGGGAINITSADVTATGSLANAILALASGGGVTVDSSAGTVSSGGNGLSALDSGAGAVSVTSADVAGMGAYGINARSHGGGVTVDSTAGTVTGRGLAGIRAQDRGPGAVVVTSADVTGTLAAFGILAGSYGGSVTVDSSAGTVLSGIGIRAEGVGAVSVTSANVTGLADFTGGGGIGISAQSTGGSVTVDSSAGTVTGGMIGIEAISGGTGGLSITTGDVISANGTGILANAGAGALTLDIGGDVTGGMNGLVTITQDGTNLTVAVGQTISGGNVGIGTMATSGSATSNDTLNILGTVNGAIMTFEGDDTVTLAASGVVNGAIMLGDGDDSLSLDGVASGALRGGDGVDSIDFNLADTVINNSGGAMDGIAEFETYNFNADGVILAGTNTGLTSTNFNAGNAILMGSLASANVNVAAGVGLQVADATTITGNLANSGSLGINMGGTGTLSITGNLTQAAGSDLTLDINSGSDFDKITVTGDVALSGALNLNQGVFIDETITLIDGGTGLSGNFSSINGIFDGGLLINQAVELDTTNFDVNLVSSIVDATMIGGITGNQSAVANLLTTEFAAGNLTGDLRDLAVGLGTLTDASALSALLDELPPEIANAGIDGVRLTQGNFRQLLINQYQAGDGADAGQAAGISNFAPADQSRRTSSGAAIWGSFSYNHQRNDTTINNAGYKADGIEFAAGISNIDVGGLKVGIGGGYTTFDTTGLRGVRDSSETKMFQFGAHASTGFQLGKNGIDGHVDMAINYATGDSDIVMATGGLGASQSGTADFDSYGAGFRLSLDGSGGKAWPVQPFVSISYDSLSQDSVTLSGGAANLVIDKAKIERITFGYGLRLDQNFVATALRLGVSGYHHSGDTQAILSSRFAATGPTGPSFVTLGHDIQNQYEIDAGLTQNLGGGWSISVDGYATFGDIEGYGGLLRIGKRF